MNYERGKIILINPYNYYEKHFEENLHKMVKEVINEYYNNIKYNKIKLNHFDGYFDYNLGNNIINDILPKETYNKDKWKYICKELLK